MEWFRSYHGAPTDLKWPMIARRASTQPGYVAAVWWALEDYASQQEGARRGSIEGFDAEALAVNWGWDQELIERIVAALTEKNLIGPDGHLTNWKKRQPKREDETAVDRKRKQRDRERTEDESHTVTHGHEASQQEEKRGEESRAEEQQESATALLSGSGKPNADAIRSVWDHWLKVSGKDKAKLTTERKQKIRTRLRTYSADELCLAIDGAHLNPFFLGENDRQTYYGNIETIFKTDTAVAQHIEYAQNPPTDNPQLTVIPGGLLDREEEDRARVEREKQEAANREQAEKAWQKAVHARFAELPEAEREKWKERFRPSLRHLEAFPERHEKALRLNVFQAYGAHIGLTLEQFLRAS